MLYSEMFPMSDEAMSPNFLLPIGVAKIERPGKDATIVAYSLGVKRAIEAATQLKGQGIDAEVILSLSNSIFLEKLETYLRFTW